MRRWSWIIRTGCKDARLLALKWEEGPRAKEHKEHSTRSWKGNLKRQGEDMSSRASGGSVAQPTHGTQPGEADFGPPTSRTGRGPCVLFHDRSAAAFTAAAEKEHRISLSISGNRLQEQVFWNCHCLSGHKPSLCSVLLPPGASRAALWGENPESWEPLFWLPPPPGGGDSQR